MNKTIFSVIINCKNSEKYIKEAVNSVLNQSFEDFEIIIIDNNSIDSTADIINSLNDLRIKYFNTNIDLNLGDARNFGLTKSVGKFIGFLDSDDLWHNRKLEKSFLQLNNKDTVFAYSNVNYFNEKESFKLYPKYKSFSKNIFNDLLTNYNLCISSCIFSRIFLNKMNTFFDPNLEVCEDYDFFLRLSNLGLVKYTDEVLVNYRIHSTNLTKTKRLLFFKEKEFIINKLNLLFGLESKILKHLLLFNRLDEAKYFWKQDKIRKAINLLRKNKHLSLALKLFYSVIFCFNYSFILRVYSLFKHKKIDMEV